MNRRTKKVVGVVSVVLALVLAAGGAVGVREFVREQRAQRGLVEGRAAFEAGEYEAAMRGFGAFVSRYPNDAEALRMLAQARIRVPAENGRHITTAADLARRSVDAAPSNPESLKLLVELYTRMRFATEAQQTAERLLAIDPKSLIAHQTIVGVQISLSKWAQAQKAVDAMLTALPDEPVSHGMKLMVMRGTGASAEEIRYYVERLIEAHPQDIRFHILAASALAQSNDGPAFMKVLEKAESLPITKPEDLLDVARLLEFVADDARVTRFLKRFETEPALREVARDLAIERAWKMGRIDEAAKAIRPVVLDPAKASARMLALATLALNLQADPELIAGAEAELERRSGEDYWRQVARGTKARRENRLGDARAAWQQAVSLELRPTPGFAEFLLGDMLYSLGERAAAIELLEVLRDEPSWRIAKSRLVTMQVDSGRLADARQVSSRAVLHNAALPEVIAACYSTLAAFEAGEAPSGDVQKMLDGLASLPEKAANEPSILGLRAWGLILLGKKADAEAIISKLNAGETMPILEVSLRLLSTLRATDTDLHRRTLGTLRKAYPNDLNLTAYEAADVARSSGIDAAKALFDQAALQAAPGDRWRYELAFATSIESVDPDAALRTFEALAKTHSANTSVLLAIADSRAAWRSRPLIETVLVGARGALGENSARFAVLEARRLLTFEKSEKNAATAVTLLTPVIENDPRNIIAALLLADAYTVFKTQQQTNLQAAAAMLAKCVEVTKSPVVYPRLVALLQDSGRGKEAGDRLAEFVQFESVPDSMRRERSRLLARQGMLDQAAADIEALGDRRTSEDYTLLASVLTRKGDLAAAEKAMNAALKNNPDPLGAIFAAAEIAARAGDVARGEQMLAALPESIPLNQRRTAMGAYLTRFGEPAKAEAYLRESLSSGGAEAYADLARFYLQVRRTDDAEQAIDAGLKIDPTNTRLAWLRGTNALGKGDGSFKESLAALSHAAEAPDASPALKGVVAAFQPLAKDPNDWKAVTARLEALLAQYPLEMDIWALLVSSLFNSGDQDGAARAAMRATDAAPSNPRAAQLAAQTLATVGRPDEALQFGRQWRELLPASESAPDFFIARMLLTLNRPGEALRTLTPRRADIEAGRESDPQTLMLLAASLAQSGNPSEGVRVLRERVSRDPQFLRFAIASGSSLGKDPKIARDWLAELTPKASGNAQASLDLAQGYLTLGRRFGDPSDFAISATLADDAAQNAGEDQDLRLNAKRLAASAYESHGKTDEAVTRYREVISAAANDYLSLNNLAMLLTANGKADEASGLARRAVDAAAGAAPQLRAAFLDTLGLSLAAAGKPDEAIVAFNQSAAADPMLADPLVGIAEVSLKRGDSDTARDALRRLDNVPRLAERMGPELKQRADAVRAAVPPK